MSDLSCAIKPSIAALTTRIGIGIRIRIPMRSAPQRQPYLARLQKLIDRAPGAQRLGCANVAHAFAAMPADQRLGVVAERAPHLAVITAYNDMLSAHQPYERYPALIRDEAGRRGATVQVVGGVPAMCDRITQGLPGMALPLFSRDTIAMATAVALTHDVFDGALLLGVCDKIVPGLLIGALHFDHLPCVFVPAGPIGSGLSNDDKSKLREQLAQGLIGRDKRLLTASAPESSMARPTATRCCSRPWACMCPAPRFCIQTTACVRP